MSFFSIVIATHKRVELLRDCLESLKIQNYQDFEVILAHSGANDGTDELALVYPEKFKYFACENKGAAIQRNEGVEIAQGEWIIFLDDDVLLEPDFLFEINQSIQRNPEVKGVSGRIVNQYYSEPGKKLMVLLKIFGVKTDSKLDGCVVGPALNFLPRKNGPSQESIQWMPTCVCAYERKTYIELGGFPSQFVGYSFGEDLFLSLLTSSKYPIILNRHAKLYHKDIGSTSHKNHYKIAVMQVDNRNYINQVILKNNRFLFNIQLFLWNIANLFAQTFRRNIKLSRFLNEGSGYLWAFINNSIYARTIR